MSAQPTARMLFLDDSGHPATNYGSGAVVIGGVAVASGDVAALNRRLLALARTLAALRPAALVGGVTHTPRSWTNEITLF